MKRIERRRVSVSAFALAHHVAIPFEAESLQGPQDGRRGSGHHTGRIQILDANQPAAAVCARIQVAGRRGEQGAQMKIAGRRGRKTSDIAAARAAAYRRIRAAARADAP